MEVVTAPERGKFDDSPARTITLDGGDLVSLVAGIGAYGITLNGSTPAGTLITIGGVRYTLLYTDAGQRQALIFSHAVTPADSYVNTTAKDWNVSTCRTTLNSIFYNGLDPLLKRQIVPTKITSHAVDNSTTGRYVVTTDKIFLLSEGDISPNANYFMTDTDSFSSQPIDRGNNTIPGYTFDINVLLSYWGADQGINLFQTRDYAAANSTNYYIVRWQPPGRFARDGAAISRNPACMFIDLSILR
jgi:hypothetical protein